MSNEKMFHGVPKSYDYIDYKFSNNKGLDLAKKKVDFAELEKLVDFKDGMTISFHHHLRNGDYVANMLFDIIEKLDLKDVTIVASSIFPVHEKLADLIKNKNVTKVYSAYISGPVADCI